jgi:small subunit ribosomal protein S6
VRDYELVLIFSPAVSEERTQVTVERVQGIIAGSGGSIAKNELWGMRRLAYKIDNFTEGNYVFILFSADAGGARSVEETLRMSEDVIRHLLVRLEPEPAPRPRRVARRPAARPLAARPAPTQQ